MQFDPGMRSGVVTVKNSEIRPVRFQLSLVEWTQDEKGADVYIPSDALMYFPRQITIAPGERSIVRIGPKDSPSGAEKTYRLRVEELPEPRTEGKESAVNLTITVSIPIFIGPTDKNPAVAILPLQLQDGKLLATVQNTGKSQFRIESLEVNGAGGYTQQVAGWYLLSGSSRQYTVAIPPEVCRKQQHLNLNVKVGEQSFTSGLDIDPAMCGT